MDTLTRYETFYIPMHMSPNEELGINRRRRLVLKAEELHMLFEPEVVRITHLVKEQIALSGVSIRKVLLVGGFGSSMYLREVIEVELPPSFVLYLHIGRDCKLPFGIAHLLGMKLK